MSKSRPDAALATPTISHAEHTDPNVQLDIENFKRGYDPLNPFRIMTLSEREEMRAFMTMIRKENQPS
jgi:hypothetical protein